MKAVRRSGQMLVVARPVGPEATETFQSFHEPQQAEVMAMVLFGLAIVVAVPYIWATYRTNKNTGAQAS